MIIALLISVIVIRSLTWIFRTKISNRLRNLLHIVFYFIFLPVYVLIKITHWYSPIIAALFFGLIFCFLTFIVLKNHPKYRVITNDEEIDEIGKN